jgi:hypothetical protein
MDKSDSRSIYRIFFLAMLYHIKIIERPYDSETDNTSVLKGIS